MAHVCSQALILFVFLMVTSEGTDGSPVNETVSASQDDDVVLPCSNTNIMNPKSCYRVKWLKHTTNSSQTTVLLSWPKTSKSHNNERVKLEVNSNGQMALFLTKFQKADEGLYSCEIWQGWDCIHIKKIQLKFKECKFSLTVKAAPSTPVSLNCPVNVTSGQQGPQNISWAMVKGGRPRSVNSDSVQMNGTSFAIESINYSDSGWYRCTYRLGQNQHCFEFNLLVREEGDAVVTVSGSLSSPVLTTSKISLETNNKQAASRVTTGVMLSVALGIVIIPAAIALFIYCRLHTHRVTQQSQKLPAGTADDYEVNLTPSDDPVSRVNSLYQEIAEEGFGTFQLK